MNADLLRPAHPPKVSGNPLINTFMCDALTSNGNDLYDPPSAGSQVTMQLSTTHTP